MAGYRHGRLPVAADTGRIGVYLNQPGVVGKHLAVPHPEVEFLTDDQDDVGLGELVGNWIQQRIRVAEAARVIIRYQPARALYCEQWQPHLFDSTAGQPARRGYQNAPLPAITAGRRGGHEQGLGVPDKTTIERVACGLTPL